MLFNEILFFLNDTEIMNIFIIEDEPLAVQKIAKLLVEVEPNTKISGTADGIESSVEWLQNNPSPDLILVDIELCDGQCFEIFNLIEVQSPVIFTTSYDEYAIQAFRVNSVDYLLKPIKKNDLSRALQKYERFNYQHNASIDISKLVSELKKQNTPREFRSRFLVKQGHKLIPIEIDDIAYFFSEDSISFCVCFDKMKYIFDSSLEEIEQMIDPKLFFRISRQFLLGAKSIVQIHSHFNGKLKLDLKPTNEREVTVSREKVTDFKAWMGR
jgi:two-component system, LytTR family, response regulator LytT